MLLESDRPSQYLHYNLFFTIIVRELVCYEPKQTQSYKQESTLPGNSSISSSPITVKKLAGPELIIPQLSVIFLPL
jgi:hypothetical protein